MTLRYELEELVHDNASTALYRARLPDGRPVAVKEHRTRTDAALFDEALRLSRLPAHPGVARYLAVDVSTGGRLRLIQEWIDGLSLASVLHAHGRVPPVAVIQIAADVLAALHECVHKEGLVHRDLSPANIMLRSEGARACIVDFGLARTSGADPTTGTARAGTVPYLSPEQVAGSAPDVTSDLFSLGVVLYEFATGQPPFCGTYPEVVAQIANDARPVTSASLLRDDIPVGLCKVLSRLLEKERVKRYPSAAAALADLGAIAGEPEGRAELGKLLGAGILSRRGSRLHAGRRRRGLLMSAALAGVAGMSLWGYGAVQIEPLPVLEVDGPESALGLTLPAPGELTLDLEAMQASASPPSPAPAQRRRRLRRATDARLTWYRVIPETKPGDPDPDWNRTIPETQQGDPEPQWYRRIPPTTPTAQ
ncbi:serine/threonine-protein kinase [Haliangium sp.]|uniref:serine/threonine-protein kinase n=1 Tax=Haliangium sp. TaxID=2663208 RepID=UPI003D0B9BB6